MCLLSWLVGCSCGHRSLPATWVTGVVGVPAVSELPGSWVITIMVEMWPVVGSRFVSPPHCYLDPYDCWCHCTVWPEGCRHFSNAATGLHCNLGKSRIIRCRHCFCPSYPLPGHNAWVTTGLLHTVVLTGAMGCRHLPCASQPCLPYIPVCPPSDVPTCGFLRCGRVLNRRTFAEL